MTEVRTKTKFANLPIDAITVGPNVRVDLRELAELAQSIRERGVLQPLTVVPTEDGSGAELLIGHRRFAAAKLAGLDTVPCILRGRDADTVRLLDQVAENSQRSDMTVLEQARAYRSLFDAGMTYAQIGARVQRSDYWVKRVMGLLELPECVQHAAHMGIISASKAIDIPRAMFVADGAEERLKQFLVHQGKQGLSLWYQGEYRRRDEREYRAEARAANPNQQMDEAEALRAGKEAQARARTFNLAAHRLIEAHRGEFEQLYEATLAEQLALIE